MSQSNRTPSSPQASSAPDQGAVEEDVFGPVIPVRGTQGNCGHQSTASGNITVMQPSASVNLAHSASPSDSYSHPMDTSPIRQYRGQSTDYESPPASNPAGTTIERPLQSPTGGPMHSPSHFSTASSDVRMSDGQRSPGMPLVTPGVNTISLNRRTSQGSHGSSRMSVDLQKNTPSSRSMAISDDFPPRGTPTSVSMATSDDFRRRGTPNSVSMASAASHVHRSGSSMVSQRSAMSQGSPTRQRGSNPGHIGFGSYQSQWSQTQNVGATAAAHQQIGSGTTATSVTPGPGQAAYNQAGPSHAQAQPFGNRTSGSGAWFCSPAIDAYLDRDQSLYTRCQECGAAVATRDMPGHKLQYHFHH